MHRSSRSHTQLEAFMKALPVELLSVIFNFVQANAGKDKRDLASCSLVSRLWRQITLPQLFAELHICYSVEDDSSSDLSEAETEQGEGEACQERYYHNLVNETDGADSDSAISGWCRGTTPPVSLHSVIAFLKHKKDIAFFVRSFALKQNDKDGDVQLTNAETLFLTINQLPSLRNLELINVDVGEDCQPSLKLVANRDLDCLSIDLYHASYYGQASSPESIIYILSFFRSINALSLTGIYLDDSDGIVTNSRLSLHALNCKHLELWSVHPLDTFISMMQSDSLQNIETLLVDHSGYGAIQLLVDDTEYGGAQVLEGLLAKACANLLHLTLRTGDFLDGSRGTLLYPLCRLQTLRLIIKIISYLPCIAYWSDAVHLLSSVRAHSTLHTIILEVKVEVEKEAMRMHHDDVSASITRLDDLLLSLATTGGSVKQVVLAFEDGRVGGRQHPFHDVISCFGDVFPKLRENDILKLVGFNQ